MDARAAIESTARVMNFANRFGNTFDAARARLSGASVRVEAGAADLAVVSALFLAGAAPAVPLVAAAAVGETLRRAVGRSWVRRSPGPGR